MVVIIILAVMLLGYLFFVPKQSSAPAPTSTATSSTSAASAEINGVSVNYVDTKGKLLSAAQGHYISAVGLTPDNAPTLYYDGKMIMDGSTLGTDGSFGGQALSGNGLHYAFTIIHHQHSPNAASDIYIDGKKVAGVASEIGNLFVADNGVDYFYTDDNLFTPTWYKDGKKVATAANLGGFSKNISEDGSVIFLGYENSLSGGQVTYTIKLNDREVFTSNPSLSETTPLPSFSLSPNG